MTETGLTQQEKYNLYLAHLRGETRSETVNLENPNVPLNGFTLSQVLSGMRPSMSGILVSPENSLKLSAVWRCISILSGVISSFPCRPFIEDEKGNRSLAKDHPTYKLFRRRPNPLYSKTVYWERAIIHLLLRGNHYSEIIYAKNGVDIERFDLIVPTQVKDIKFSGGKLWYALTGRDELIPMERMIHVPHMGEDPISGKSTITYAREDLGMEMARRDSGAKFWQDGGQPTQLLIPQQKITPTQEAQLKTSFREKKREGGAVTAPFGVEVVSLSMSPADQEFIMSGNFSIAAICRWFGVPLHKLSELERATFSNIEHQAIEFLQDTISPIIEKVENEYETKCYTLPSEADMELEFDMNTYQRADIQGRSEYYRTAVQNALKTPNEVRKAEGDNAMEGGDRLLIQQNMMPLDKIDQVLMKQQQKPAAPPATKGARLIQDVRELLDMAELDYKTNSNGNGQH